MPLYRGYREADVASFDGVTSGRDLVEPWHHVPPPTARPGTDAHRLDDRTTVLLVAPAVGYALLHDVDWTDRRAALSIGVREGAREQVDSLLREAARVALDELDLQRIDGTTVSTGDLRDGALVRAGFRREGALPGARWHEGRATDVICWGRVRDDVHAHDG